MTIQGFTRRLSLGRIAACFFSRSGSAMTFRRTLPWSLLLVALLSACSPVPYQPAIQDSLQNGYRSEEIAPGVFVIEVRQNSRLRLQLNREETLHTLQQHWQRRAAELCKHGYRGSPEVVLPVDARLRDFQCSLPECQHYPLVSGIAWCHQRYEL